MMLKSVSFSPLVSGKAFNAIQMCSSLCLRNGGQLRVFSTSLTCPQHHPSFYLIAAKSRLTGTPSCGLPSSLLQQGGGNNSAALRPSKQLTYCNVKYVNGFANKSSQAGWIKTSECFQFNSTSAVKAVHGKPYTSARLQEGFSSSTSSSSSSSSASPVSGSAQKLQAFRPWLLLGLCICTSAAAAAGSFAPRELSGSPPASAEALARRTTLPTASSSRSESEASHGKKVYFDYHVTGEVMTQFGDAEIGVPGDGRCLFRAVAHGACLRSGKPAPDESTQRQMADDLRNKALDELVRRRESSEWFIEGDFDAYVRRMRLPHTWGGEPELLMLSNVLRMPITVYMKDKGGIIAIAEYGQEHGTDKPIRVLYHGFGHYEALHLPEDTPVTSRLVKLFVVSGFSDSGASMGVRFNNSLTALVPQVKLIRREGRDNNRVHYLCKG